MAGDIYDDLLAQNYSEPDFLPGPRRQREMWDPMAEQQRAMQAKGKWTASWPELLSLAIPAGRIPSDWGMAARLERNAPSVMDRDVMGGLVRRTIDPGRPTARDAKPSTVPGRENVTNFPGSAFEYADGGAVDEVPQAEQGSVMGKQPLWQSPFAFLGSAPRNLPSISDQARSARAETWNAPPLDLALGMAMGPKVKFAPRPTAGTTPASPRQSALQRGREEYGRTGSYLDRRPEGDRLEAQSVWDRDIDFKRAWDYRQVLQDFENALPPPKSRQHADGGEVLAQYGHGYSDPRLEMDSADLGTQDVLRTMDASKAAEERKPYQALANLFTTALAPAAAAHKGISGSNLPRAINFHNRMEQKMGNDLVNWATKPFLSPILALMAPGMARAYRREDVGLLDKQLASPLGRVLDKSEKATDLLSPHISDTARILNQLNEMQARDPNKYGKIY